MFYEMKQGALTEARERATGWPPARRTWPKPGMPIQPGRCWSVGLDLWLLPDRSNGHEL